MSYFPKDDDIYRTLWYQTHDILESQKRMKAEVLHKVPLGFHIFPSKSTYSLNVFHVIHVILDLRNKLFLNCQSLSCIFQGEYYLVPTQQIGFPDEKEHIANKRQCSHRQLFNTLYLFSHVVKSLDLEQAKSLYPQILDYMFRCEQVIAKYCNFYFGYNVNKQSHKVSTEEQMKNKIITMCNMLSALCKFIKVRVSVNLKDDPKAHDIIHSIFGRKDQLSEFKNTLLSIDYWYEHLTPSQKQKYSM